MTGSNGNGSSKDISFKKEVGFSNVDLSYRERTRFFFWCRDMAMTDLAIAAKLKKMNLAYDSYAVDAMRYLFVAREVFPYNSEDYKSGRAVSIEDILNGVEPEREEI